MVTVGNCFSTFYWLVVLSIWMRSWDVLICLVCFVVYFMCILLAFVEIGVHIRCVCVMNRIGCVYVCDESHWMCVCDESHWMCVCV